MSQLAELRALPVAELRGRAASLRKELEILRLKLRQGGSEHPHRIRLMKRQLAQLLTLAHAADSLRRSALPSPTQPLLGARARSQERASRSTT